ncbi:hypothetical protein HXA34_20125 [Salipaludibacillus agaradhaerens]|uniref:hypothetical protein n=1 Tax=Salipaludibacillus agaradhaerens TaxID=76935 RepID=UPI0021519406|nr:hypothetical protein [Salipaludibacillus agaradhaerens]MCR6108599.1 hypothetical protein [Salipaludibacillus agaradhaerens]MCR6120628.1 hypothetical protein [Salipaludibacillus agaradhaerens]
MFYSIHSYGADIQLLGWSTDSFEEAKRSLIKLMAGVRFDKEEDDVKLYKMDTDVSNTQDVTPHAGVIVFDYQLDYLDLEGRGK